MCVCLCACPCSSYFKSKISALCVFGACGLVGQCLDVLVDPVQSWAGQGQEAPAALACQLAHANLHSAQCLPAKLLTGLYKRGSSNWAEQPTISQTSIKASIARVHNRPCASALHAAYVTNSIWWLIEFTRRNQTFSRLSWKAKGIGPVPRPPRELRTGKATQAAPLGGSLVQVSEWTWRGFDSASYALAAHQANTCDSAGKQHL